MILNDFLRPYIIYRTISMDMKCLKKTSIKFQRFGVAWKLVSYSNLIKDDGEEYLAVFLEAQHSCNSVYKKNSLKLFKNILIFFKYFF